MPFVGSDAPLAAANRAELLRWTQVDPGNPAEGEPEVDGDFDDPNAYLNVSGPWLWIEIEPPGHVEAADLDGSYDDTTTLPEPDGDLCLWLTVASVPAGAPAGSAETARRTFESLAARYDGIAIDPAE